MFYMKATDKGQQAIKNFKKTLCTLGLIVAQMGLIVAASPQIISNGADFFITSVIREVPMKQNDTQYKDFYINAGVNNGLRKGVFIDAIRKMGVYDNMNAKLIGDTPVKVARLKVIHSDKTVSIARLVKYYDKEETPLSGYDSVVVGDLIEVSEKQ